MVKVYLLFTIPPKYLDFLVDYFHSEKRKTILWESLLGGETERADHDIAALG